MPLKDLIAGYDAELADRKNTDATLALMESSVAPDSVSLNNAHEVASFLIPELRKMRDDIVRAADMTQVAVTNPVEEVAVTNFPNMDAAFADLSNQLASLNEAVSRISLEIPDKDLQEVSGTVTVDQTAVVRAIADLCGDIRSLKASVEAISVSPTVNVPAPKVQAPDLSPIVAGLSRVAEILSVPEKEEKPCPKLLGMEVLKDRDGDVRKIVETYDTGTVEYDGFLSGKIRVTDNRA